MTDQEWEENVEAPYRKKMVWNIIQLALWTIVLIGMFAERVVSWFAERLQ